MAGGSRGEICLDLGLCLICLMAAGWWSWTGDSWKGQLMSGRKSVPYSKKLVMCSSRMKLSASAESVVS